MTSHVGRARSMLLDCAGADRDVLGMCPTETEKTVNLGAAVLVSSAIALAAGTIAAATVIGGGSFGPTVWAAAAPIGLMYALVVFAIDRAMVSTPLNPPNADGTPTPPARTAVRVAVGVTPRLFLAVLMGVLAAEPLLLLVFRSEIDTRISAVHADLAEVGRARIDAVYADELAAIDQREAELSGSDPTVTAARAEVADLDEQIATAEAGLAALELTLRDEIAGTTMDGTSGRSGDGPVADQIRSEIDHATTALDGLRARRTTRQTTLDDLTAVAVTPDASAVTDELARLATQRTALAEQRTTDLAALDAAVTGTDGLLIRIEALEWLSRHSLDPSTGTETTGLTSAGIAVWLLRVWLITLDVLPVMSKTVLSLRTVRPYDELTAARAAGERRLAHALARVTPPLDLTGRHPVSLPDQYRPRAELIAPAIVTRPASEPDQATPATAIDDEATGSTGRRPRGLSVARTALTAVGDRTQTTAGLPVGSGLVPPPAAELPPTNRDRLNHQPAHRSGRSIPGQLSLGALT